MHIWALKNQKLPGPLSGPWTLAADSLLCSHDSQLSALETAPPEQILDPHLRASQETKYGHKKKGYLEQNISIWVLSCFISQLS